MERVNNVRVIKSNSKLKMSPDGDFFRCWVAFMEPFHKLTEREQDVLALFLKKRYELSKVVTDADTLDSILMAKPTRVQIMQECGISYRNLLVVLSKFRKRGVLKDNRIFNSLIPSVGKDGVGLMIYFDFKNEQQRIKLGSQASLKTA